MGVASVALWKGKKEEREKRGAEELLPSLTCNTLQLAGGGCQPSTFFPKVSKSSCHKQMMAFAFQAGKPNVKCHEQTCIAAACYSNILLPVSAPTESIWFVSCLLFCKHYKGYSCQKTTHFSLPWPFISLPRLPSALCWHKNPRGSWEKTMEELLAN